MRIGGNYDSDGQTDDTDKLATINMPHYSSDTEQPIQMIRGFSDSFRNTRWTTVFWAFEIGIKLDLRVSFTDALSSLSFRKTC